MEWWKYEGTKQKMRGMVDGDSEGAMLFLILDTMDAARAEQVRGRA